MLGRFNGVIVRALCTTLLCTALCIPEAALAQQVGAGQKMAGLSAAVEKWYFTWCSSQQEYGVYFCTQTIAPTDKVACLQNVANMEAAMWSKGMYGFGVCTPYPNFDGQPK